MPKVSVYLSDDLYRRARDEGVSISAVAQSAIEAALSRASTRRWAEQVRERKPRVNTTIDVPAVLREVRDEFAR